MNHRESGKNKRLAPDQGEHLKEHVKEGKIGLRERDAKKEGTITHCVKNRRLTG